MKDIQNHELVISNNSLSNLTVNELIDLITYYKFDDLTGLMQRKDLFSFVSNKMENNDNFYLTIVDVDNLHTVNRVHGMKAGDKLIRTVSSYLIEAFGLNNVYRYGGDEFVVIHENLYDITLDNITYATKKYNNHSKFSLLFNEVDSILTGEKKKKNKIGNCIYRGNICATDCEVRK